MINVIVLATNNENKVKEFQSLLQDVNLQVLSLADFGPIPEALEDGETFDENSYKKAHHVARVLGLPTIADDSGLVVTALGGKPGVHSARYAGDDASDDDNIDKLLMEMKDCHDRSAYFQCVISIAVPSGPALTYEARCEGEILTERQGSGGFGYDPVFFVKEYNKSFAELSMGEKNAISHRGKALFEVKSEIDKIKKWLELRLEEEKPAKPDHDQFLEKDWSDE